MVIYLLAALFSKLNSKLVSLDIVGKGVYKAHTFVYIINTNHSVNKGNAQSLILTTITNHSGSVEVDKSHSFAPTPLTKVL
jgi:hypothetical protein